VLIIRIVEWFGTGSKKKGKLQFIEGIVNIKENKTAANTGNFIARLY
jgi:hypothetical protein